MNLRHKFIEWNSVEWDTDQFKAKQKDLEGLVAERKSRAKDI